MPHAMPAGPTRARHAHDAARRLLALTLAAVLVGGVAFTLPHGADAATARPLAVIVVGPTHGVTWRYLADANRIADQLRAYGARVRRVYSPWATWDRVRAAAKGANLLVYLGHGNGYPSPHGPFNAKKMDGFGLNAVGGRGHWNTRYFGEYYVARLHLAPGAVVLLHHVCYAGGSSEPGHAYPRRATATRRVDNFAAGFLRAGAAAVFATSASPRTLLRDLFRSNRTMASVFWNSPESYRTYASTFWSRRTPGMRGILAPRRPGQYYMAVTGRLSMTAREWRHSWIPAAMAPPTPSPDPSPSPVPSADPGLGSSPDPAASPTPSPDPTPTEPGASPTPDPATPAPGTSPSPDPTPDPGAGPTPGPTPLPEPTATSEPTP